MTIYYESRQTGKRFEVISINTVDNTIRLKGEHAEFNEPNDPDHFERMNYVRREGDPATDPALDGAPRAGAVPNVPQTLASSPAGTPVAPPLPASAPPVAPAASAAPVVPAPPPVPAPPAPAVPTAPAIPGAAPSVPPVAPPLPPKDPGAPPPIPGK